MRSLPRLVVLFGPLPLVAAVTLGSACSATNNAAPGTSGGAGTTITPVAPDGVGGSLPCDVDAVLAANCRKCHDASPKFGAPMALVTAADLHAPAKSNPARRVYELVPERIADDTNPMPQPPNARLGDADRATLTSWAGIGAPAGTAACGTTTPPPDVVPTACTPDLPIAPASDYVMQDSNDVYVCYGVELSRPTPTHVVGFSPRIDNTSIVHHVVVFESDQAVSPTPTACNAGGSLRWHMVTGWAPGGTGFELPPEAGFPIATTGSSTHYVVQVHYSNPQGLTNQKDHSGFDLCTSAPRKYDADVIAFGTQNIKIPTGAAYSAHCTTPMTGDYAGKHFIASMPHMHKLGTDMSTELHVGSKTGPATDMGTVKGWSFNSQAWLPIGASGAGGAVSTASDFVTTTCTWKNTTGAEVTFGEKTSDEMCYSFTTYYPKIPGLLSWAQPALTASCTFD
ncbi:MAG: hypothetical protein QOI41_5732 [Myxococcales bacterium]|nr:hypothetical protein [Myxococcales bacterium]